MMASPAAFAARRKALVHELANRVLATDDDAERDDVQAEAIAAGVEKARLSLEVERVKAAVLRELREGLA